MLCAYQLTSAPASKRYLTQFNDFEFLSLSMAKCRAVHPSLVVQLTSKSTSFIKCFSTSTLHSLPATCKQVKP